MHAFESAWQNITREFDTARTQAANLERSRVTHNLNQFIRRLRRYQTETEWAAVLTDGARDFAPQAALFALRKGSLHLLSQRDFDALSTDQPLDLAQAAAFSNAVVSQETVITLRSVAEVGQALSSSDLTRRAYLFPVVNGDRVVAILFVTEEETVDVNALELLSNVASMALERQANLAGHTQIGATLPVAAKASEDQGKPHAAQAGKEAALPSWFELDRAQRLLHMRAQRFSRVKVAEMQLFKPDACRAGREHGDLYVYLKREIDGARDAYRKQFMSATCMVDYLHLELVRTAAEGDEMKLGADYPGQMV